MTVRDTSLAAYRALDLTAGQRRVLGWLLEHSPYKAMTRQQIADASGIPINVICPRIHELLHEYQAPPLEELPAVDGAHPVRVKAAATQQGISKSVANEITAVAPAAAPIPQSPSPDRERLPGGLVAVPAYLQGRMSMTPEQAREVLDHPLVRAIPEWHLQEARDVMAKGLHWRAA